MDFIEYLIILPIMILIFLMGLAIGDKLRRLVFDPTQLLKGREIASGLLYIIVICGVILWIYAGMNTIMHRFTH